MTELVEKAIGGGLEGAERNSRELFSWNPSVISPDMQLHPVKDMADARSRDVVQNDGYALGVVNTNRDSIVGGEYRLNAQPEWKVLGFPEGWAEEFQEYIEPVFNLLANSTDNWFDASRNLNFTGLIRLTVTGYVMSGEDLASVEWVRKTGRPFHTAIQQLAPQRLSNPDNMPDSRNLRRGKVLDEYGEATDYWIRSAFPNENYDDMRAYSWRKIPARKPWGRPQMIHIYEPLQPGQSRGVSDMVSVLKQMRMTKKFQDVTLQNAVVNATYAAAVESELPREVVFGAMGAGAGGFSEMLGQYMASMAAYVGASNHIAIDGVKMPHLFPGTKLNLKPMGTPGGVGTEFEHSLLRHTAAGLGLSYEQFARDYTKTNYSSARASMGETYKYMQSRKKIVADRKATIIYMLIIEELLNRGDIPLPRGVKNDIFYDPIKREALCSCEWLGASKGQIDEKKETESAALRIHYNLSTLERESAILGTDWRRNIRQKKREKAALEAAGLSTPDPTATANPKATDNAASDNDEDNQ